MARIPGKAEATTTRALYARSRGVTPASRQPRRLRLTKRSELAEQRDPHEARREQALIQSTMAKIIMVRRKAEQLRDSTVARDASQAEISRAAVEVIEQLAVVGTFEEEVLEAIRRDLGDLPAEGLRVTR